MASTKDLLLQVFPHVPEEAIDDVLGNLGPQFENQPERLLDRASSELLRGNFTNKKRKLEEEDDVIELDAGPAPKPQRNERREKQEIMACIEGMAPTVDMDWLSKHYEHVKLNGEKQLRDREHIQSILANYILEHSDYPKRQSAVPKPVATNVDYSKYNDPITCARYRSLCLEQIQQDFRWITLPSLREVLERYNFHYYPSYNYVKTDLSVLPSFFQRENGNSGDKPSSKTGLKVLSKPRLWRIVPHDEAVFSAEYEHTHQEEKMRAEEEKKEKQQKEEDEKAEREGNVMECGCCFVDVPMTRMVQCGEGHLFCADCIKRYVEESAFSSGQTTVHCLDQSGCKANFPISQLERAIPGPKLAKIFARLADLDIKKSGLENVHACPFCDFQMEIANPDEKLFKCLNPECLRESCLLCKEPNHIPQRCEEVEKQDVTSYRKKVEEAMTASLVRTCPKCKAKFYKADGCNKMTCSCGAYVCYICRILIPKKEGYDHFCKHQRNPQEFGACPNCKKCYLFLKDTQEADDKLVEAAKEEATKEFAGNNEELASVKVGVQEDKKKKKSKKNQNNNNPIVQFFGAARDVFGNLVGARLLFPPPMPQMPHVPVMPPPQYQRVVLPHIHAVPVAHHARGGARRQRPAHMPITIDLDDPELPNPAPRLKRKSSSRLFEDARGAVAAGAPAARGLGVAPNNPIVLAEDEDSRLARQLQNAYDENNRIEREERQRQDALILNQARLFQRYDEEEEDSEMEENYEYSDDYDSMENSENSDYEGY